MTPQEIQALRELLDLLREDVRDLKQTIKDMRHEIIQDRERCQRRYDAWLKCNTGRIEKNSIGLAKINGQAKTAGGVVAIIASSIGFIINRLIG